MNSLEKRVENLERQAQGEEDVRIRVCWGDNCDRCEHARYCDPDDPDAVVLRWPEEFGCDELADQD